MILATSTLLVPNMWIRRGVPTEIDLHELAVWVILKLARGGAADNDASEVAMNPVGDPSFFSNVTTATPAPCRRKASRKAVEGLSSSEVVIMTILSHKPLSLFPVPDTMGPS